MIFKGFRGKLGGPVIGLAPMDGVTDAAFRYMTCKHSKPNLVITEFTNVEGLARGATKMLRAFIYDEIERPILAQIFGVEVESFYKAAVTMAYLEFDGVDINMGCPAKKVEKKGSGAGLIKNPKLAARIIKAVQEGVKDFSEGITLEEAGVHKNIIEACKKMHLKVPKRRLIPVSVKTRIGYDKPITEEWVKFLLETGIDMLSIHGRTLKQMYSGKADWEEIAKAAIIAKKYGVKFLGNGDINSMKEAREKIKNYGVDGVLVGRAAMGNPWFFGSKDPKPADRLKAVIEHCKYFIKFYPDAPFFAIRKHLAWYSKGFDGAKELRTKLIKVDNFQDVHKIIENF